MSDSCNYQIETITALSISNDSMCIKELNTKVCVYVPE